MRAVSINNFRRTNKGITKSIVLRMDNNDETKPIIPQQVRYCSVVGKEFDRSGNPLIWGEQEALHDDIVLVVSYTKHGISRSIKRCFNGALIEDRDYSIGQVLAKLPDDMVDWLECGHDGIWPAPFGNESLYRAQLEHIESVEASRRQRRMRLKYELGQIRDGLCFEMGFATTRLLRDTAELIVTKAGAEPPLVERKDLELRYEPRIKRAIAGAVVDVANWMDKYLQAGKNNLKQ